MSLRSKTAAASCGSGPLPDLRKLLADIIDREVDGIWEPMDVADAIIKALGFEYQEQKVDPECSDGCQPLMLRRWVSDWQVNG